MKPMNYTELNDILLEVYHHIITADDAAAIISCSLETPPDPNQVTAKVRITESEDMGIFLHVSKKDGGAGMKISGTPMESWAREILDSANDEMRDR